MPRSRSRSPGSRSRSPRSRSNTPPRHVREKVDVIKVSNDDAAFIIGKGGKTKEKLARVSGASIELIEKDLILEIRGTESERAKARRYIECVMAQRVGPVRIDYNNKEDLTTVDVPSDCIAFVTGARGSFLRSIEEEFGTLMVFAEAEGSGKDTERLAIFGPWRGRRGSELKVFATIETKRPGYYTKGLREEDPPGENATTLIQIPEKEVSWALGKNGSTRRKLAAASGAILEYVGNWAFISGSEDERARCRDYLDWTMAQLDSPAVNIDTDRRDDCTVIEVPEECIGYVTGKRRATLQRMEEEWHCLMVFIGDRRKKSKGDSEKLAIFGSRRARAGARLKVMSAVETKLPGIFTKGIEDFRETAQWGSDTFRLKDNELSYALGKDGSTRKKLANASGCIIQYVGNVAYFCGEREERRRARKYMLWLLEQRNGEVRVSGRDMTEDVLEHPISREAANLLISRQTNILQNVEADTNTFVFLSNGERGRSVFICSHLRQNRQNAANFIDREIRRLLSGGGRDRYDDRSYDRYDDRRGRSDSYDRYDRRRRRSYSRSRSRDRRRW